MCLPGHIISSAWIQILGVLLSGHKEGKLRDQELTPSPLPHPLPSSLPLMFSELLLDMGGKPNLALGYTGVYLNKPAAIMRDILV